MKPLEDGCTMHVSDQDQDPVRENMPYQTFLNSFLDLLNLDFAESFDLQQRSAGGSVDRLWNRGHRSARKAKT